MLTDNLESSYKLYALERMAGAFGEMGSWPLVLPYLRDKKVLDIGCSDGLYLQHLSSQSLGLEQIPELVERARRRGLRVEQCDVIEGLGRQESSLYDAVLFSHVMEHIDAPIRALREINRVLRPAGTLMLGLPIENCLVRQIVRHDYFNGTHLYAFTVRNACKLLSVTGFKVNQIIYHLPKIRGKAGAVMNRAWNVLPIPFKEYFSMAYWIHAMKEHELFPAGGGDGRHK
ncbi:MAG: class I SAM-dependent methyltransferase [Nitrospira sp. BO4]|jgi:SAM-dependent methyltransferase|nr:class I SAM-dependent methyltransferase [Nitrospira sp. BO4]